MTECSNAENVALEELEDEDLFGGQVVLEASVCHGANLELCVNISHPELDPERHQPICEVSLF